MNDRLPPEVEEKINDALSRGDSVAAKAAALDFVLACGETPPTDADDLLIATATTLARAILAPHEEARHGR
ncbi:hypothetical protein [Alsobacter sp. R-9]